MTANFDQFYNHDDKEAEKKKTQYSLYADRGRFDRFEWHGNRLVAHYKYSPIDSVCWLFNNDGSATVNISYTFGAVVDLMGISFDYPENKVQAKRWVGLGPYRVWQNRMQDRSTAIGTTITTTPYLVRVGTTRSLKAISPISTGCN